MIKKTLKLTFMIATAVWVSACSNAGGNRTVATNPTTINENATVNETSTVNESSTVNETSTVNESSTVNETSNVETKSDDNVETTKKKEKKEEATTKIVSFSLQEDLEPEGTIKNKTYKNKFFDITYKIPEGFEIYKKGEVVPEFGVSDNDMTLRSENGTYMMVLIEDSSPSIKLETDFQLVVKGMKDKLGSAVEIVDSHPTVISGKEAYVGECDYPIIGLKQKMLFIKEKNQVICFIAIGSADNANEINKLIDAINVV